MRSRLSTNGSPIHRPSRLALATATALLVAAPAGVRAEVVQVVLEMEGEALVPTWVREAGATRSSRARASAAVKARAALLDEAQDRVVAAVESKDVGGELVWRVTRAYNGVAVRVEADRLPALRALPGVKAVRPLVLHQPANATSVPLLGVPEALWQPLGATGEGVKLGVIDSGLDYQHASFGGSGLEADYRANDRTKITDGFFPTARVVGGHDFAGDAYTGRNNPSPDPDPMDCGGHGSHVAGTAAGGGVKSDGTPFTGPYDGSVPFAALRIGPGAAPKAKVYALRIFGCSGSTGLTTAAVDWAVDPNKDGDFSDHLDVLNLSLGSPFGTPDEPSAVAVDNAARLGVFVVCSAGNEGDTAFAHGSPGVAARVLSVAASTARGAVVRVTQPTGLAGTYAAGDAAFGPRLGAIGVTGAVAATTPQDACTALTNAAAVRGKIALLDRGSCNFTVKVKAAQDAGAVAVIVANNTTGLLSMSGSDPSIVIPSVVVTQADGQAFRAAIPQGLETTLLGASDTLTDFSSRGPGRGSIPAAPKPDVAAPGSGIVSVATGVQTTASGVQIVAGSQAASFSGTSMSSPLVAGFVAALRQLRPSWTVAELKALVVNTAKDPVSLLPPAGSDPVYGPARVGAGRVDGTAAAVSEVIAYSKATPERVGLSFFAEANAPLETTQQVEVYNKGGAPVTLTPSFLAASAVAGVAVDVVPAGPFELGAGEKRTLDVRLRIPDPGAVLHPLDPTMSPTQATPKAQNRRAWVSEASGWVVLTGGPASPLKVPVHAAVKGASAMRAASRSLGISSDAPGPFALKLTGNGIASADVRSTASAFELQATSPDEPSSIGMANAADLAYAGVMTDVPSKGVADGTVWFAVATHGPWTTPYDVEVRIDVDLDGNGSADARVRATDSGTIASLGSTTTYETTDVVVAFTSNAAPGFTSGVTSYVNLDPSVRDTALFYSDVMVVPAPTGANGLKLSATSPRFSYRVSLFHADEGLVDETGWLTYDPAKPGLLVEGGLDGKPFFDDAEGASIAGRHDLSALAANKSTALLLLHHHNAAGSRAEVVLPRNSAPTASIVEPAAGLSVAPGDAVRFVGQATDPDAGDTLAYRWDFGDGTSGTGKELTHAFVRAGTLTVTLTVVDGSGAAATAQRTVTVTSPEGTGPELFLPVVLETAGVGGSFYTTELTLVSRATTATTAYLGYTASRGSGSGIARVPLAAGETRIVPSALAFLRAQGLPIPSDGSPQVGTLRVTFAGAAAAADVFAGARTSTPGDAGSFGLFNGPAVSSAGPLAVTGLQQSAAQRSNVGLVNAGATPVTLRVALLGPAGEDLGTLEDVPLGPWEWTQLDRPLDGKAAAGRAIVTRVAGSGPFTAYGVLNDAVTSDGSFVPPLVPGDTSGASRLIPVVLDVTGEAGSHYRTELTLANLGTGPLPLTLTYRAADGFGGGSGDVSLTLAAGQQQVVPDTVAFLRGQGLAIPADGSRVAGSLLVKAPAGVAAEALSAGARTFTPAPSGGGTFGVFTPGLTIAESATAVAWVHGLQQNAAMRSNLAVVNRGDAGDPITLRVSYFGANGQALGTPVEQVLAAGEWLQWGQPLAPFGATAGSARVERTAGASRFVAYGVLNDAATSDGSVLPMAR